MCSGIFFIFRHNSLFVQGSIILNSGDLYWWNQKGHQAWWLRATLGLHLNALCQTLVTYFK